MFRGVIVPLITPFKKNYSIDHDGVRWLVKYLVREGVNGLFPNSTTGEFVHLRRDEIISLVSTVVEEASGHVLILPGVTANSTIEVIDLAKELLEYDVNGFIIAPPYYFKYSEDRLKKHFSDVAERIDKPLILYNIPATTGVNLSIKLVRDLAIEHSNIAGVKATIDSITYLRRLIQEIKSIRRDFSVLTGLDELFLPNLMIGGDGGIVALANVFPRIHVEIYRAWESKDYAKAIARWRDLLELARIIDVSSSYSTAVKTALKLLGAPIEEISRPPLYEEDPETKKMIENILKKLGISIT
ncbi:MAG: dihydrodipicolinate synthase family protein [Sulfolobales archaeon]